MKAPLTSTPFHGEPDVQAMIVLLAASRAPDRQDEHPSPGSLRKMLSVPAHREGVRLWRDADARLAGMRLLRARGVDWAVMGTLSDNIAMQRAAQSAGFRVTWEKLWYARPLTVA
jgi:hypothetical protein